MVSSTVVEPAKLLVKNSSAVTVKTAYDAAGNVISEKIQGGEEIKQTFDKRGRRTGLTVGDQTTAFTYNNDNSPKTRGAMEYEYDSTTGRLVRESSGGADGFSHVYGYDDHNNRTSQTTYLGASEQEHVVTFDGPGLPSEISGTPTGTWSVSSGELLGVGAGARAQLGLPGNLGRYEVKVRLESGGLAAGDELSGGFYFWENENGRYTAEAVVYKEDVPDVGAVLKRKLRIYWRPNVGNKELREETDGLEDAGGVLTLSLEQLPGGAAAATLSVGSDDVAPLAVVAQASSLPVGVGLGLFTGERTSAPALSAAYFDDLKYWTLSGSSETRSFTYGDMNELKEIYNGATLEEKYFYNPLGQLERQEKYLVENSTVTQYEYDRLNRLINVSQTSPSANINSTYTYNAASWMRESAKVTRTSQPAVTTRYWYDGFACTAAMVGNVKTNYGVFNGQPLWETTGTQTMTYAQDGLGNVSGLWNGSSFEKRFKYDAFGQVKEFDGGWNSIEQKTSGPRYRGQLYDGATGQVYLRNRYYAPGIGRFNTFDPLGHADGWNMYLYAGADPVNNWDPMGLSLWDWVITGAWNPTAEMRHAAERSLRNESGFIGGTGSAILAVANVATNIVASVADMAIIAGYNAIPAVGLQPLYADDYRHIALSDFYRDVAEAKARGTYGTGAATAWEMFKRMNPISGIPLAVYDIYNSEDIYTGTQSVTNLVAIALPLKSLSGMGFKSIPFKGMSPTLFAKNLRQIGQDFWKTVRPTAGRGMPTFARWMGRQPAATQNSQFVSRLSEKARSLYRDGKISEALDVHYENLVRARTGGTSKVISGREIDSVTNRAFIQAKRSYSAIDRPKNFLSKAARSQIKETISLAKQYGVEAQFWFKYGVSPMVRAYIESKGGVVVTGIGGGL